MTSRLVKLTPGFCNVSLHIDQSSRAVRGGGRPPPDPPWQVLLDLKIGPPENPGRGDRTPTITHTASEIPGQPAHAPCLAVPPIKPEQGGRPKSRGRSRSTGSSRSNGAQKETEVGALDSREETGPGQAQAMSASGLSGRCTLGPVAVARDPGCGHPGGGGSEWGGQKLSQCLTNPPKKLSGWLASVTIPDNLLLKHIEFPGRKPDSFVHPLACPRHSTAPGMCH